MNYEAGAAVGVRHCGTARQRPQPQQQRDDCSRSRASARPVFTKTVVCVCVLLRVVGWGGSGAWQYGRFYAIYCRRLRLGLTRAPAQQIRAGVVEQTKCVVGKSGWGSRAEGRAIDGKRVAFNVSFGLCAHMRNDDGDHMHCWVGHKYRHLSLMS